MKPCLVTNARSLKPGKPVVLALSALIICLLKPASLEAGAWTEPAGHGQVILTSSLFRTGTMFDENGDPQPFGYGGRFRQFIFNPYVEYGLTPRNTLIVNANVPWLNFSNSSSSESSAGFGDIEAAIKRRFNSTESKWALSGQFTVLFPAYSVSRNPAPGNHNLDVEGRVMAGRGLTLAKHHAFYDAELAYRYRNGAPADQVRADASAGLDAARWLTLMGQFFAIKGMRNGEPLTVNSNPNAQSDFDLYKYQPSVLFNFRHGTRLQVGMNSSFSGRNTGTGHAAILALWKTF